MKLAYKAYDSLGKVVTGTVDCSDTAAATETLRRKGLFVAEIDAAAGEQRTERKGAHRSGGARNIKDVAVFTRQLCVLVSSGTRIIDALGALEEQIKPGPWRQAVGGLRIRIEEGASLSRAMEEYPQYFDRVYQSLVSAGESSGHLTEMLDRMAELKHKQLRIRQAVIGATIYPCLLITVALTMFPLMLLFVVPRFAGLFKVMDVPLPASTRALVQISALLRGYWWLALLLLASAVGGVVSYLRSPQGKHFRDSAVLKLPYIGTVVKNLATARIVRLLGVLLDGHVPMLDALHLIRSASGNCHYAQLVTDASDHVVRGEPISEAFGNRQLIAPSVHQAVRSGEQSGRLDSLLLNIADFLDEENETIVRSLTSLIEPAILIVMGILVGLIAVSLFMPLFDLASMTQRQ